MPPRNTASACHTAWTESTSPSWKGTDEYYTFYYSTDLVTCVVRSSGMADNTDGNPYLSAIDTSVVSIAYHSGRTVDTIAHLDASGKPVFFMNYLAGNRCADFTADEAGRNRITWSSTASKPISPAVSTPMTRSDI